MLADDGHDERVTSVSSPKWSQISRFPDFLFKPIYICLPIPSHAHLQLHIKLGLHFGSQKTVKISTVLDLSRNSFFIFRAKVKPYLHPSLHFERAVEGGQCVCLLLGTLGGIDHTVAVKRGH